MVEEKSRWRLAFYALWLMILFLGVVHVFALAGGYFLALELAGFIFLLALSLVGLVGYARVWGERVLFFVFLFYLINLILVWYVTRELYLVLMLSTAIGLAVALFGEAGATPSNLPKKTDRVKQQEKEIKAALKSTLEKNGKLGTENGTEKIGGGKAEAQPEVRGRSNNISPIKKLEVKYSPGKYVASTRSNHYHEPKCDWAKKIRPAHRIWFSSKEEAWEKGFKAHGCVK